MFAYIMQWDHAYILLRECFSFWGTENPVRIQEIMKKDNYIHILDENIRNLQRSWNMATTGSSSMTMTQAILLKLFKKRSRRIVAASWSGIVRALAWIPLRIYRRTWRPKWWSGNQPIWPTLSLLPKKDGPSSNRKCEESLWAPIGIKYQRS